MNSNQSPVEPEGVSIQTPAPEVKTVQPSTADNRQSNSLAVPPTATGNRTHSNTQSFVRVQEAIGTAARTGQAIADTALGVTQAATKQTYLLLARATQGVGQAVALVTNNPVLGRLMGFLKLDWILGASNRVDVVKAEAAVRKLQQEHPNESPSQIAHRIMVEKAVYAGGMGLATSFVPGEALALLAVDLATTAAIQAEMIYQIACAYGLDLKDPARKGEVLTIFGLGLGGSRALRAVGLGILRSVPVAGAVIGASSNAVMLYSLGYAACRFYEAKLDTSISDEKLVEVKQASNTYLENAIAQQVAMDRVLVHMILASHPEKSWEEILPNLKALNLSPTSLEVIAANIKSPQPLETLLNRLNRDYAMPLLALCYRIAKLDGAMTPAESRVIQAISARFDIDLKSVRAAMGESTSA
jgi:uncharacterized protein (DUF697 family)